MSKGILLVNLGSPDSTNVEDVRTYLREFLMDKKVLDSPWIIRKTIVELFILPKRPEKSAEAYRKIWTKEGSPLIVYSKILRDMVQKQMDIPVVLAMRYKNPSIEAGLQELYDKGVRDILVVPLYPQYTMSSTETVADKVLEIQKKSYKDTKINFLKAFYNHPDYIKVLGDSIKENLPEEYDKILFTYHGIPERHDNKALRAAKISKLPIETYRNQCFETTRLLTEYLQLPEDKYTTSFQSRLGRDPWIKPYTDYVLEEFPEQGVKNLVVCSPAFVADCLETLEEISMEGQEEFLKAGGEQFTYIPCLNDRQEWVDTLVKWLKGWQNN
ncbi:ferrochelatase [Empedobacter falsenii]|jgi:ferrochelatase|uniref:Ferrochelatase n=1 Tax=Empedobacter falsenii TaxID=343874 RepID=A0A376GLK2_9FLAO|nr:MULTISPECIES: ferrochelatase [Empedobacter]HAR74041.1 ferrochelatase [Flavobacteriaceae bacterium]MDH1883818.1 ferrochelatase [Empedobacter sp. GD03797]MDM1041218.1 ferrochelatase [Empedobacter brevis]MDM1061332.1 ferrochelatase [Empedobacter falsenii]MDM1134718.1 ferrochelatase [Empedobacter sp. R750]